MFRVIPTVTFELTLGLYVVNCEERVADGKIPLVENVLFYLILK